ncbi:MAG: outer membrane beta-barrel protein [Bacteroidota bacterium]
MREEEFINSLKNQADGFEVTPSAGLFDKIIVSGNLKNKAAEQDFANILKEKAADFSVAPSACLFDKISAANKTQAVAEVEQFSHIVKNKAKDFKVSPNSGLFEKIVITRNHLLARRYATYGIAAILLLSVSSFLYWLSHSTDALKNETVYVSGGAILEKKLPKTKSELNNQSKQIKMAEDLIASDNSVKANVLNKHSKSKKQSQTKHTSDMHNIVLLIAPNKENAIKSGNVSANTEKAKHSKASSKRSISNSYTTDGDGNSNVNEASKLEVPLIGKSAIADINANNIVANEKPIEQKPSGEEKPIVILDNNSTPEVKENAPIVKANPPIPVSIKSVKKIVGTKWAIGIYGTPQLLKSEYHSNKTKENWANEYLQTKIQNDKSNFNYQAGLLIERKLSNSFSVVSGIGMSQIKFRELRVVTYMTPSEASGTDVTISNKEYIRKSSYDVTMNYLEVPLHIQYTKHWNKFSLSAQVGMAYNLLMDANAAVYSSDTVNTCIVQGANKTLQQHVFYFSSAIIAEYFPSKHISIFSGPTYRDALNSVYDDKYVLSQKPYFYGLTMGVKYAF